MLYSAPIIKRIWGSADTILFIFAGAAAEFAVNKAVDWLYFTGRLPSDPLGRLFSTVTYARDIIFSPEDEANKAIDRMGNIHRQVEDERGSKIPDWAYRDVLFMLIYYSIRAFEVLERNLSSSEKEDVVAVFINVGKRMQIPGLPHDYQSWWNMYVQHTHQDLARSTYTRDLFKQYRRSLGSVRYFILVELQKQLVTPHVRRLLGFGKPLLILFVIPLYKMARKTPMENALKYLLMPAEYRQRINALNQPHR